MKGKTKRAIIIATAIVAILVITRIATVAISTSSNKDKEQDLSKVKNFVNIIVVGTKVKKGDIQKYITLSGDIRGISEAQVFPDVPGKVEKISFAEGQYVKKDEPIMYIDRSLVGYQYNLSPVRAPIDGRVGSINVSEGQFVSQTTPVAVVVNNRIVEIILLLPEKYVNQVKRGSKAIVEVPSLENEKFIGYVYSSDLIIDRGTRTLKVRIRVDNPSGKLISGMYANVKIPVETEYNTTYVPITSIREIEGKTFVYVLSETNIGNEKLYYVSLRNVLTSVSDGEKIGVKGVNENEIVVSLGAEYLKDGIIVRAIIQ